MKLIIFKHIGQSPYNSGITLNEAPIFSPLRKENFHAVEYLELRLNVQNEHEPSWFDYRPYH